MSGSASAHPPLPGPLAPSGPPGDVPPRPDLPPPRRRRRRWPIAAALALVVAVGLAQLGAPAILDGARRALERPRGEFAFLGRSPEGPYRWNPCQPITYEVNLTNAPPGALADVREAVRRVSEATGIRFIELGTTTRSVDMQIGRAFQSRAPGEPRFYPVLIDWVPHEHFDFVVDTHRAAAFAIPYRGFGALARTYVSGVVAMDAGEDLPPGFGERYSRGVVLMHELGHVMGLDHVGSPHELMWAPDVSSSQVPDLAQTDWGPGDLEGLRRLGRDAGCLPARR